MNRILSIATLVAIAVAGYFYLTGTPSQAPGVSLGAAEAQDADVDTSMVAEMTLGNPDADVTVIEYASFTCPHCANFHAGGFNDLKSDFIDTGLINYVYREVYFDRFGLWAGMLARCGGEERYFGLVSLIYENQRDWTASGDPAVVADNLRRLGRTAGLEDETVNACLQDNDMANAMVAVYQENATADGVSSTPSFLVNGQLLSGNNYNALKAAIDEALGS